MSAREPALRTVAPSPSDADLLRSASDGDEGAFRLIVEAHLPKVLATARRLVGELSEAEDVAQEAFVRLWQNVSSVEVDGRGLGPWLARVTRNLAIDRLRSAKRLELRDEPPDQAVGAEQLAILDAADVRDRVFQALEALPDRQRLALSLFHFEELSQREVAEALELNEEAVESLLARARRKLRALLAEDWQALLEKNDGIS